MAGWRFARWRPAIGGALAVAALAGGRPVAAQAPIAPPSCDTRFVYDLDHDIDQLVVSERFDYPDGPRGQAIGFPFALPAGQGASFDYNVYATTRQMYFLGTSMLGDPGGVQHIVLGVNSGYPAGGADFGSLFARNDFSEQRLIDAIDRFAQDGATGDPGFDEATGTVFRFGDQAYASNAGFFPYAGGQNGGACTFYAFSSGMPIGDGITRPGGPFVDVSAAPEPGAWAMMIVGFGAAGGRAAAAARDRGALAWPGATSRNGEVRARRRPADRDEAFGTGVMAMRFMGDRVARRIGALAVAGALSLAASPATAALGVSYDFVLNYDIDVVITDDQFPGGLGFGCCGTAQAGVGGYRGLVSDDATATYLLGTTRLNMPGGAQHLVLALRSGTMTQGQDFTTPGFTTTYGESQPIDAINVAADPDASQAAREAAGNVIGGFGSQVYAADAAFAPNAGSFAIFSFSDAQLIGSGVTVAAAPEAQTWALPIAGFGIAGGVLRRRARPALSRAAAAI